MTILEAFMVVLVVACCVVIVPTVFLPYVPLSKSTYYCTELLPEPVQKNWAWEIFSNTANLRLPLNLLQSNPEQKDHVYCQCHPSNFFGLAHIQKDPEWFLKYKNDIVLYCAHTVLFLRSQLAAWLWEKKMYSHRML